MQNGPQSPRALRYSISIPSFRVQRLPLQALNKLNWVKLRLTGGYGPFTSVSRTYKRYHRAVEGAWTIRDCWRYNWELRVILIESIRGDINSWKCWRCSIRRWRRAPRGYGRGRWTASERRRWWATSRRWKKERWPSISGPADPWPTRRRTRTPSTRGKSQNISLAYLISSIIVVKYQFLKWCSIVKI